MLHFGLCTSYVSMHVKGFHVMLKPGRIAICLIDPYVQRCHVLVFLVLCHFVLTVVMIDMGDYCVIQVFVTPLLVK